MFNKIISMHKSGNSEVEIHSYSRIKPHIKGKEAYVKDSSTRDSNVRVHLIALPSSIKVNNELQGLTWKVFWFKGEY